MGYAHGTEWSEELIIEKINEVINGLELKTFPTKSQMKEYFGNNALADKLSRTGGIKFWANKLNLNTKDCESKIGESYEMLCIQKLEELGFDCEQMKPRYPYDLTANNHIKVDVKSGFLFGNSGSSPYYSFNLEKSNPTCDIFVVMCLNGDKSIKKTYIIPSCVLYGKTQLSIGVNSSIYDKFLDRWDVFDDYKHFYSSGLEKYNQKSF